MTKLSSRRNFLYTASVAGAGFLLTSGKNYPADKPVLDHLLLGASSLEDGIAYVKDKTGVQAIRGGKHPNIGTHNALLALGNKQYLEIIAPNPEATLIPMYAFLKEIKTPYIFTWAARTEQMESLADEIKKAGFQSSGIRPGSRQRDDGRLLQWKSLSVATGIKNSNMVPFFIEWDKNTLHPSADAPAGCTLKSFNIYYPEAEQLKAVYTSMGIEQPVLKSETAFFEAILQTAKGEVKL